MKDKDKNLHICNGCGLEYESHLEKCNSSNDKGAKRTHKKHYDNLRDLDRQKGAFSKIKQHATSLTSKISKATMLVVLIGISIFVIYLFFYNSFTKIKSNSAERTLLKAEKLYNNAEYKSLYEMLDNNKYSYKGRNCDYYKMSFLYVQMKDDLDGLYEEIDFIKAYPENDLNEEFLCSRIRYCVEDLYNVINYKSKSDADITEGLDNTKKLFTSKMKSISDFENDLIINILTVDSTDNIKNDEQQKLIDDATKIIYERLKNLDEI